MMRKNKIELIAPAGNLEKLKTALAFGADAVYAGIPDFSLRVRINDFDLAKLKEATEYCHQQKKKIYVTTNIFAHNRHLEALPKYIKELKKLGVDALIISDPGIISLVKKNWPEARIHLSTQANCTNWSAAKFWYDQGVRRVVLGRETTLAEIKEIKRKVPKLELEYFAHGAMCMAYSGRCFLSKYFLDRSANLGDCVQPCRWRFNASQIPNSKLQDTNNDSIFISEENRPGMPLELVSEEGGSYILNSKDLCLLPYLRDLVEAGVTSFKIEGRAKSVYYQAMVAGIYSHVTHNLKLITKKEINYLYKELETKLVHRGYTTGFLLGEKADQNLHETHIKAEWEFCGMVVKGNAEKNNLVKIKVHNTLKVGDELELVQPQYEVKKFVLKKLYDEKTGEAISEAHGGQDKYFLLEIKNPVGDWGVIRRRTSPSPGQDSTPFYASPCGRGLW